MIQAYLDAENAKHTHLIVWTWEYVSNETLVFKGKGAIAEFCIESHISTINTHACAALPTGQMALTSRIPIQEPWKM